MRLEYYRNLDGVRAIAALMVIMFHFFTTVEINSSTLSILQKTSVFGQTGVTLFFVLSGFLITRILISMKEHNGDFRAFYARRILRIFPLYYLFLLMYYFLVPLLMGSGITPFKEQIYYYTFLQSFTETFNWNVDGPDHFWSLAVEEHFYLFWPFIVYFASVKNLYRLIGLIIIGAFLLRIYMLSLNYDVYYFTFTRFDSLAIGALLSLLELKNFFIKENASKFLWLTIGIFVPTGIIWMFFTGESNNVIQVFKYLLLSFTYFALIGYVLSASKERGINRILQSSFFSYTGKISYGLYVYHPLVFALVKQYIHTNFWVLNLITGVSFTFLTASLSFHFFEERILGLKKHFEYKRGAISTPYT
jgi:peptidoglycan/LPS O-acetylase OafA/YrhL